MCLCEGTFVGSLERISHSVLDENSTALFIFFYFIRYGYIDRGSQVRNWKEAL